MKIGKIRFLAAVLSAVMLLGTFAVPASAVTPVSAKMGDVDGDGDIVPRDAAIVARYLAGWADYVDEEGNIAVPDSLSAGFSVGYSKENITPDLNYYKKMPLAGYGDTDNRLATGVPQGDGLYATCIAIRDEAGQILLLFSMDRINSGLTPRIKAAVHNATGVSEDYISVTATHTHTGPDNSTSTMCGGYVSRYNLEMIQKMASAAKKAINNLSPATLWAGDTHVTNINFVRRFLVWYSKSADLGSGNDDRYLQEFQTHALVGDEKRVGYEGPNVVDDGAVYYAHETEGDNEVQYILFKRDGLQDVLLYNWQCHPDQIGNRNYDLKKDGSYVGSYNTTKPSDSQMSKIISADFINGARNVLEKEGYLTAYFQGAAGNMNQRDRVRDVQNQQIGSDAFKKYRLAGWDTQYYTKLYKHTTSSGNSNYWKSQMVGAIVADSILKDVKKDYATGKTVNRVEGLTYSVDDWVGPRQLDTGNIGMTYTTYYTTFQNNDRDIGVVMDRLARIAAGTVSLNDSYTVKYLGETTFGKEEFQNLANDYDALETDLEKRVFANTVLQDYSTMVRKAFSTGMSDNGGSLGSNVKEYPVARLKAYLATGLYINNYYAGQLVGSRKTNTDLSVTSTDPTLHTDPVVLYTYSIGQSVAFCMAPYEMFDTIGQEIKDGRYIKYETVNGELVADTVTKQVVKYSNSTNNTQTNTIATYKTSKNGSSTAQCPTLTYGAAQYVDGEKSPFALTFICGYSNGSCGYIPTRYARNHTESQNFQNGYETYVTKYAVGTAEEHGDEFITMLNILYNGEDPAPRTAGHIPAES